MSKIERTELETDHLTGEITRHSSTVVQLNKLPPEPEYIKLYIQDLGRLKGLQPSHREILVYVAACVGYDGTSLCASLSMEAIASCILISLIRAKMPRLAAGIAVG